MSYSIQVTDKETGSIVETKDISHIQTDYGRQLKLNIFRAGFKDEFLLRHKIEIVYEEPENDIKNEVKMILVKTNQII